MSRHSSISDAEKSLARSHAPLSNFALSLLCVAVSVTFCGGFLLFCARLVYQRPLFSILFAADAFLFLLLGAALCRFRR